MSKCWKSSFIIYTIISCLLLFYVAISFLHKTSVTINHHTKNFSINQGNTVFEVAHNLQQQNIIYNAQAFILLTTITGNTKDIHAGEYEIPAQISLWKLIQKFKTDDVIKHSITFVEGWTFNQIKQALAKNIYLKHELKDLNDSQIMQRLGHEGMRPEGLFAPDTYVFSGNISDTTILRNAYDLMQKRLQTAWQHTSANNLYKCPYDLLIMSSMLEKESAIPQERPLIASVIFNRLKIGMPLQIDATVIYGLGLNDNCPIETDCNLPKLTIEDLKNDSGYNTYTRKGLPIAPIASPSLNAIQSALNPSVSNYLYYVADNTGHHVFSKTLEEHNKAKYQIKKFGKYDKNTNQSR